MPKSAKKRLDVFLVEKGYLSSRSLAQSLILSGQVLIDERTTTKAGALVSEDQIVRIKSAPKYVSRGGEKLEKALHFFNVGLSGHVCADIGSSTGGFVDCLLQNGAKKVYAIDCGTNQLDYRLRSDPRVVAYEETNVKGLKKEHFQENVQIVTMDLSFISVKKILVRVVNATQVQKSLVILLKPQFEGEKEDVDKGGVVKSKEAHEKIVKGFFNFLNGENLLCSGFTHSPITGGKKGNIEYLLHIDMQRTLTPFSLNEALSVIDEAFYLFK